MSDQGQVMDEARRRQYLKAMGIQVWVPRREPEASLDLSPPESVAMPPASTPVPEQAAAVEVPPVVMDASVGRESPPEPEMPPWLDEAPWPDEAYEPVMPSGEGYDEPDLPEPDDGVSTLDWEGLAARVAQCTHCNELVQTRTQTVFGVGDRQADWLFIGEAPGAEEDRQGEPFVGRAGKLLDSMLAALGKKRGEGVYIANILKCHPPRNRDPSPEEARACRAYLDRQIQLIRPKILVALGRVAAQNLLDTGDALGSLRGRVLEYRGIPVVVTYHPAYLLRRPSEKRKSWEDLCRAMDQMQAEQPS
ncbi:MAG: uracil-DNA glycosylase [Pseudomonadota bacterium]